MAGFEVGSVFHKLESWLGRMGRATWKTTERATGLVEYVPVWKDTRKERN